MNMEVKTEQGKSFCLTCLPPEILQQIFGHLECLSLISLFRTCRLLRKHAESDLLWANLLREQLPNPPVDPFPSPNFRSLYMMHHPYWFLPKHRIWFSDNAHTGKLVLIKYDSRRGCIEGYRLLGSKGESSLQDWFYIPLVKIHSFEPTVTLHRDRPVIKFEHASPPGAPKRQRLWDGEVQMRIGSDSYNSMYSTFFLSRAIPRQLQDPSMEIWPPKTIPTQYRVRSASQDNFQSRGHKPHKHKEISEHTFRLRTWVQFTGGASPFGVRMGEEVSTWSTLDPELYTPTTEKPYQGIWVGDYSGHGCEFLLVMQRDTVEGQEPYRTENLSWNLFGGVWPEQEPDPSAAIAATTHEGNHVEEDPAFRGRIEAVKLTGDVNVPRGEYSWIADDIGSAGFVRIAEEEPFQGARIVRSRGQLAARGFQDAEFVACQLIMISHDKLAQYWIELGHVSFYQRVDIDALVNQG